MSLLATFPAAFYLLGAISDDSAPRMAAKAAVGACFAIIPYVFARAVEKLSE